MGVWDGGSILIHGAYGHGKTRFLGDVLSSEAKNGKVLFGNCRGEDGYSSIKNLGLGNVGYNLTTFDELLEFIGMCEKEKPVAVALDSLKAAYQLAIAKKVNNEPRMPKVGDSATNEWGEIHLWMTNAVNRLKATAKYTVIVCPTDLSKDTIKETESGMVLKPMLMPDLPGKMAAGCVGWFDLCGYLSADVIPPERIKRTLSFAPSKRFITRQRLPNALTGTIDIPEGGGAWANVLTAVSAAYASKS